MNTKQPSPRPGRSAATRPRIRRAEAGSLVVWKGLALARALSVGCRKAPTVVIISACYSGAFTAMRAPNRIILTAARPDRPSFGCQADRTYTVFDECLLGALPQAATWRGVRDDTLGCVRLRERELGVLPSQPQAFFGKAVRKLMVR